MNETCNSCNKKSHSIIECPLLNVLNIREDILNKISNIGKNKFRQIILRRKNKSKNAKIVENKYKNMPEFYKELKKKEISKFGNFLKVNQKIINYHKSFSEEIEFSPFKENEKEKESGNENENENEKELYKEKDKERIVSSSFFEDDFDENIFLKKDIEKSQTVNMLKSSILKDRKIYKNTKVSIQPQKISLNTSSQLDNFKNSLVDYSKLKKFSNCSSIFEIPANNMYFNKKSTNIFDEFPNYKKNSKKINLSNSYLFSIKSFNSENENCSPKIIQYDENFVEKQIPKINYNNKKSDEEFYNFGKKHKIHGNNFNDIKKESFSVNNLYQKRLVDRINKRQSNINFGNFQNIKNKNSISYDDSSKQNTSFYKNIEFENSQNKRNLINFRELTFDKIKNFQYYFPHNNISSICRELEPYNIFNYVYNDKLNIIKAKFKLKNIFKKIVRSIRNFKKFKRFKKENQIYNFDFLSTLNTDYTMKKSTKA